MLKSLFSFIFIMSAVLLAQSISPGDGYLKVDPTKSTVHWVGKKVTGQHDGSIALKEGTLQFKKGILIGGSFTIDMTTIKVLDLQGESAGKLENHLKSDDFFSVQNFPSATLIILESKDKGKGSYEIRANLTIKGITKQIEFPVQVVMDGDTYKAAASITIDRSQYDVKYRSGKFFDNLGDKTIYDNFDLKVSLVTE